MKRLRDIVEESGTLKESTLTDTYMNYTTFHTSTGWVVTGIPRGAMPAIRKIEVFFNDTTMSEPEMLRVAQQAGETAVRTAKQY